jgi:hypothetical protein
LIDIDLKLAWSEERLKQQLIQCGLDPNMTIEDEHQLREVLKRLRFSE